MTPLLPLLAGVRVLDLGTHPSAALGSMVLADFGAMVTAVVLPGGEIEGHPAAPMMLRAKHVLGAAAGADYNDALKSADVVITTLGPDEKGPVLSPQQIQLNISGWGMQGPYARYPMSEGLVAAKSGRMAGFEGQNPRSGPVYSAVQVATFAAGQIAVQGVLAALMVRARTGKGQRVETSLLQAIMPYDTSAFMRAQLEVRYPQYLPPEPVSEKQARINYQPLQAKDGRWMQQGNLLDHLFKSFLKVAGLMEAIPEAERKKAGTAWSKDTTEMMRTTIMKRIREKTAAEWIAAFKADGNVAVAAYQSTQEALDDPDFIVSGAVVDVQHPQHGAMRWLGPAAHMEATPAKITVDPKQAAGATPLPKAAQSAAGKGPLSGVTILEFASIIATPMGVSMLGDLGARIIKVEPIGGDPGRRVDGAMAAGIGAIKYNVGKQSICIELKSPRGREILDKLLPKADLIAHNFRPGVPDKLGFGYERAKTFNPKVVWLSANGFGPTAPSADSPCSHPIAGALSGGAIYQAGGGMPPPATDDIDALLEGARRMMRANEVNPDPSTAMIVATAGMLGLYATQQRGTGQRINVDMMLANAWANFDDALRYAGKPSRAAVDSEGFGLHALYRLYPCASGWVFIAVRGDANFSALCAALGMAADARFADEKSRRANDAALAELVGAALRRADAAAWEQKLSHLGCVEAGGPQNGEFWLPDAHIRESGFVRATPHKRYGEIHRHGPLMTFSEAEMRCGPGVLAGEHVDELLAELGYDAAAIATLRAEGVVWSEPVDVDVAFGKAS